jgi:hypothetical protein
MQPLLVPVDHGLALARLIPGCRLRLIAGADHMFFHRDLWAQLAAHVLDHARAGQGGSREPLPDFVTFLAGSGRG